MTALCIETATEHGLVAIVRDDGSSAFARWRSTSRHGENLFGYIDRVLAELGATREELSLIGVDTGPGRFTSLRVGLGTAKGLALGLQLPIVGVSSLRVLGRSIEADPSLIRVPIMNAYRGDVFAAAYRFQDGTIEEISAPSFGPPERVFGRMAAVLNGSRIALGGEGAEPHAVAARESFGAAIDESARGPEAPSPQALAAEVRDVRRTSGPSDLDTLEPQYLRPSDAKLPAQTQRAGRSS
jgi:tRNA threonylcarbamoyladenosine biosynthesis protein TsaB